TDTFRRQPGRLDTVVGQLDTALFPLPPRARLAEDALGAVYAQAGIVAAAKFVVSEPLKFAFVLRVFLPKHHETKAHARLWQRFIGTIAFITIVKVCGNARLWIEQANVQRRFLGGVACNLGRLRLSHAIYPEGD